MNKHYAAFILFFSYFLFVTFLPKNVDSASKQTANKISNISENTETAILAGGCFWCMEHPYEDLPGISQVISGYTGGKKNNPTYKEVASGSTLHVERSEEHTSELQSQAYLVCRLLLEKKKKNNQHKIQRILAQHKH